MPVMEQPQTKYLTVEMVSEMLEVPTSSVRYWIMKKRLTAYKFGRELKVKPEDLEKFIEESRTNRE